MDVETLKNQIKELEETIRFIEKNKVKYGDSLETLVFKKYLELESTKKVTEYINNSGYKKPTSNKQGIRERKYITTDISSILKDKNVKVEAKLKAFVMKLFNKNKRGGFN